MARYFDITSADVGSLVVIGIQALVVGVVLRIVFGGETPAPPRSYQLMFLLGVSAFWFGCNNAAKEIIKELRLFEMERNVNLRISTYVLSKFAVLALLGAVEVGILFAVVRLSGLTFAHQGVMLGLMILAMAAGTGCGLFLSGLTVALQKTEDVAVGLVPIALIPQILLANALIAPLPDFAKSIGEAVITAFWSYRAELHAFGVTVENGGHAWRFLVWHAAGFTVLAMIALWIGGLRGHKRD